MDIELVSKPARQLLKNLIENKNDDDCVSEKDFPDLVNLENCWLYELKELGFITTDYVPSVILTNRGLTYPERRKAYLREIMLTSFWLPILVSVIVSLLISSLVVN